MIIRVTRVIRANRFHSLCVDFGLFGVLGLKGPGRAITIIRVLRVL